MEAVAFYWKKMCYKNTLNVLRNPLHDSLVWDDNKQSQILHFVFLDFISNLGSEYSLRETLSTGTVNSYNSHKYEEKANKQKNLFDKNKS